MARLPAGITETSTGRYQVRPYDRKAKKKGPARTFDSVDEAVDYKRSQERPTGTLTCDEWVREWTTNPAYARPSVSTNRHNRERVEKFATDHAGIPLKGITRVDARKWAAENRSRLSSVRAMFNDARLDGLISDNPFAGLRLAGKRSRGRKDVHPLTAKEVGKLSEIAYEVREDWPVMGANILVAAYTGMRQGELLGLTWQDIDWAKGTIHVARQWRPRDRMWALPKNGQERTIPLYEPAANALRALPKDGPTVFQSGRSEVREDGQPVTGRLVWYSPQGKMLDANLHFYYWKDIRTRFWERLKPDRQAVIDKGFDWHELRHFTASWLVDLGAREGDVAAMLGHTDGGALIRELYGHLYPDNSINRLKSAVAKSA